MATVVTLVRALPWAFFGRLATAFLEIVLAVLVLSSSLVLGHELRDWRTWYGAAEHPWSPTRPPALISPRPVAEPRP
jgi:hypothetical protein